MANKESHLTGRRVKGHDDVQGYDYEFIPPPDPKYECAICILVLREPQQTKCGHRFCKACITKWLRESNKTCPIDNQCIEESDLFADNFAKREIQNFHVRCPNANHGCDKVETLLLMQKHEEACKYGLVPCPNNCSDILLRKDLPQHLITVCCYRLVSCPSCREAVKYNELSNHHQECPEAKVKCQRCGQEFERRKSLSHDQNECEKTIVHCKFQPVGCLETMERGQQEAHMDSYIKKHLQLICDEVLRISQSLGLQTPHMLNRRSGDAWSSLQATQISDDLQNHLQTPMKQLSLLSQGSSDETQEKSFHSSDYPTIPSVNMKSLTSYLTVDSSSSKNFNSEFASLKKKNQQQDELLAKQRKDISDLFLRCRETEKQNRELKLRIMSLESALEERNGRACSGVYFWRIRDFSRLKHEAEVGNTTALHSPPFYSSVYGYKLCVRININSGGGTHGYFLSVFIHFLQSENDDLLNWPFSGRIVLTVMDQNPECESRLHIMETLASKPNLSAFQKPTQARNHRGFGYMEFAPISVLEAGHYLNNDTLIIKAHVIPTN